MYIYSFRLDWVDAPPTKYHKNEMTNMSRTEDDPDGVRIVGCVNFLDESYNYEILLTNANEKDYEFLNEDIKNENGIIANYLKEHVKRELRANRALSCSTKELHSINEACCENCRPCEWNRREPDFYICIKSFILTDIGDEGELLETQSKILKGSMWNKEKSKYRFCSTPDSVRLENYEKWIEISNDSFLKYFTPVWKNE